jgi:hypothetical protein
LENDEAFKKGELGPLKYQVYNIYTFWIMENPTKENGSILLSKREN